MLQPQALASMLQEYEKAHSVILEKTKTLEKFRDEYKELRNRLKTLPDKIEYDALVPLGTKALAPGKIVHTNEILCMLGDSWFMECSAKTATEIVDRRIKTCNKHLDTQKKEMERLDNWRHELTKLILESTEEDSTDIVEVVNDEEYESMEKEHRESVRRHHQELARERVAKSPEEKKKEEEDFWARLEELELQEEMEQAEEEYAKRKQKQVATAPPKAEKVKPTKPKVVKTVSFNQTPEIREIPSISRNCYDSYADESEPIDIPTVSPKEVAGVAEKIVERTPPVLISPDNAVGISKSKTGFDPREAAVPIKKVSLFKERRCQ